MNDLGTKNSSMYPTMEANDNKMSYRSVTLPMAILGETDVEIGDEVTLTIKGIVKMKMEMDGCCDLTIEAREGEVVEVGDSKAEYKS